MTIKIKIFHTLTELNVFMKHNKLEQKTTGNIFEQSNKLIDIKIVMFPDGNTTYYLIYEVA